MKILLLNPNMSTDMTGSMARVASAVTGPGTTLVPVTAKTGFPYISSRAEAQVAGAIVQGERLALVWSGVHADCKATVPFVWVGPVW